MRYLEKIVITCACIRARNIEGSGQAMACTCSLRNLENCWSPSLVSKITNCHRIKPATTVPVSVWRTLPDAPVTHATCVSVRGCLVAVGVVKSLF